MEHTVFGILQAQYFRSVPYLYLWTSAENLFNDAYLSLSRKRIMQRTDFKSLWFQGSSAHLRILYSHLFAPLCDSQGERAVHLRVSYKATEKGSTCSGWLWKRAVWSLSERSFLLPKGETRDVSLQDIHQAPAASAMPRHRPKTDSFTCASELVYKRDTEIFKSMSKKRI